ncbi:hypothetical protein [Candidatus Viridilinea mediisalina]|uniref:Uncharacterized protein n=1 Tax=Candidatus Viridilinea mediisalina TaxID=2024553 RepID=A0A2A6RFF5_9CHLR|nr:hypothetical protein [Candidatus Viridilinea mediisalina]PDW01752.1 hypothetical protein CJ255_17500 [Candidatus Viridilinea mediisalina]
MLSYEDLVTGLEDAWLVAGFHEHAFVESVVPATHDRTCRLELFPDHDEPLTSENMPPFLDLSFTWSPAHQLLAEGRSLPVEPLDLTWVYTATVVARYDRSDLELVRMFQRSVMQAFQHYYPAEAADMEPIAVEVRRIYLPGAQAPQLDYIQLVSSTVSDLFEQWGERDLLGLRALLRQEFFLASAIISHLADAFAPHGRGGYTTVDAA